MSLFAQRLRRDAPLRGGGIALPMPRASIPFEGAGAGRRARDWTTSNEAIVSLLLNNAPQLRARSRQLVRNHDAAASGVDSWVSNCIGTGIKPQPKHENAQFRDAMTRAWKAWTDQADVTGQQDFYGMQATICRSEMEAGECFGRFIRTKQADGAGVPLQIQVIEADHVPEDKTESLGKNQIKGGIEIDALGRRLNYYVWPEHPGDSTAQLSATEPLRIPAGEMIHVYKVLRPGQLRGQPRLTPIIVKLQDLLRYDDAMLQRALTAAMFAGFIHKTNDSDIPFAREQTITPQQEAEEMKQAITGLEPGLLQVLLPGWDISFSAPADAGATYEPFIRKQLRGASSVMGVTYEQGSGDLENVNYSSIRAGLVEIRRRCRQFQHQTLVFQLCRRVWKVWLEAALLSNSFDAYGVSTRAMLSEYNQIPQNFLEVDWHPEGYEWVDPQKDIRADTEAVRAGFKSRSQVIEELGEDPEDVDRQIAADNSRADSLGLRLDSDARNDARSTAAGTPLPTDPAEQKPARKRETIQ